MDIVGIIAEYNPFHNGHAYMLNRVREILPHTGVVVVMSGSVTQRGEVAVTDKWHRAQTAVMCGADLVLELPTVFVLSSAQNFALGGVAVLKKMGCVSKLAFGTEFDEIDKLRQAAAYIDSTAGQNLIRETVNRGHAYQAAVRRIIAEKTAVGKPRPNTVLALEYLRAVNKLGANLEPVAINRYVAHHLDTYEQATGIYASATAIREMLLSNNTDMFRRAQNYLPSAAWNLLSETELADTDRLYTSFLSRLAVLSHAEIAAHSGVGEGLGDRLREIALTSDNRKSFIAGAAGKRYGTGRLGRVIMSILLGLTTAEQQQFFMRMPLYGRILAFNSVGREIIRRVKDHGNLPLVTRVSSVLNRRDLRQYKASLNYMQQMLRFDIQATLCQNLAKEKAKFIWQDYLVSPVFMG